MIYQVFTSQHELADPEKRSIFVTIPLTLPELEKECQRISPDGSLFNMAQKERKFDIYKEENGVKMCYVCQEDGMTIVAEYPDDVQLRAEVTEFFRSLSDAEQAIDVIQSIPMSRAVIMTTEALVKCDNFIDFIRAKHNIERCHYVMR